jgi:hypothetical protein
VRRQAKVVVRGEVDDLAMIEGRLVALFPLENAELTVQTLLLERIKFAGEIVEWIAAHPLSVAQPFRAAERHRTDSMAPPTA